MKLYQDLLPRVVAGPKEGREQDQGWEDDGRVEEFGGADEKIDLVLGCVFNLHSTREWLVLLVS